MSHSSTRTSGTSATSVSTATGGRSRLKITLSKGRNQFGDLPPENEVLRAFLEAAALGEHKTVQKMVKSANNVDDERYLEFLLAAATAQGHSALHIACFNGHARVAQLLLEAGADRERRTQHGRTALQYAEQQGHRDIVELFARAPQSPKARRRVRVGRRNLLRRAACKRSSLPPPRAGGGVGRRRSARSRGGRRGRGRSGSSGMSGGGDRQLAAGRSPSRAARRRRPSPLRRPSASAGGGGQSADADAVLPGGVNVNELMRIAAETEAQSATPRPPLPSLSTKLSSKLKR